MPLAARSILLEIRELVLQEAKAPDVGMVDECLKWGQPSYVTHHPKTGTTLRLACTKDGEPALFTHCQSGVMDAFRALAPASIRIEGNRAAILDPAKPVPSEAVRHLIRMALTYHLQPKLSP
ncbi:MAG: DUF1801 domain-containing protein [Pseudomonadota bacterium]